MYSFLCLFLQIIFIQDIIQVYTDAKDYPFNGNSWAYKSITHYTIFDLGLISWFIIGTIISLYCIKTSRKYLVLIIHIIITSLYVLYINFFTNL